MKLLDLVYFINLLYRFNYNNMENDYLKLIFKKKMKPFIFNHVYKTI